MSLMIGLGLGLAGRAGGATAAWAPTAASVPLLAWYRADLGVTAPANVVSQVDDQSGAADANRNQTGTATLVPTDATYGNQASVSHAAQTLARVGTWTTTPAAPITVVIIGEIDSSNKGVLGDTASSNLFWSSGANWAFYDGATLDSGVDATTPAAMMFTDDGTGGAAAAKIYVNDLSTPAATTTTMFNAANGLDIGSGAGLVPNFTGKWAEIIIFDGVLTPTDVDDLKDYLNTTRAYGIAVT